MLGIELDTLYRYARAGKITAMKVGKAWRFAEEDLRRFLEARRAPQRSDGTNVGPRFLADLIAPESVAGRTGWQVIAPDHTADIDQLRADSARLATVLRAYGIGQGDRVLVALGNGASFVTACFAVWRIGGVLVPDHAGLRRGDLQHLLHDARPSALIVDSRLCEQVEQLAEQLTQVRLVVVKDRTFELSGFDQFETLSLDATMQYDALPASAFASAGSPEDSVSVSYTSGSTGHPKGVVHTHASWLASAAYTADHVGLAEGDTVVVPLPIHHGLAFRQMLTCLTAGADLVLATDIFQALMRVRTLRPTAIVLVPTAVNILIDRFAELLTEADAFLRYIEVGSAAIAPDQLRRLQALLPTTRIHLPYGLTEARVGYLQRGEAGLYNQIASVSPGLSVTLQDDNGRPASAGNVGEIVLRGRGLMRGYYRRDNPTADTLRGDEFHTGDMGLLTPAGHIELLGRRDNIVKVGGRKVNPAEIEMVLNGHPSVAESAVVAMRDDDGLLDHHLRAFVVPRGPESGDESMLRDHCRRHMPEYKVPTVIHFRRSLPKSPVGKILHKELALIASGDRNLKEAGPRLQTRAP